MKQGGGGKTKVVGKLRNGMKLVAGLSPSLFHITSTRVAACDSASVVSTDSFIHLPPQSEERIE